MRSIFLLFFVILLVFSVSCVKKNDFTSDPSVGLEFSSDSVLFDTVFTGMSSITQRVKVFNRNNQAVRINNVVLAGGEASSYKINIDGIVDSQFSNLVLRGNDSLNLFVKVNIEPDMRQQAFRVEDYISFSTNGNHQKIALSAYGQNAKVLTDLVVDDNLVLDDKLPYIIYGTLKVDPDKILTIKKGARLFFHKDAGMLLAGSLKVEGELRNPVIFASDRLERIYAEEPGQWKGLHFLGSSKNNIINHARIKNAIVGIQTDGLQAGIKADIVLANSIIKNMELFGLYSNGSSIDAFNTIITNCGKHLVYAINGGKYNFKQNTFFNSNYSFIRLNPSLAFSDGSAGSNFLLSVELVNNIIWGNLQDELLIEKNGSTPLALNVKYNLIKTKSGAFDATNILNKDPLFKSTRSYNFFLTSGSVALDKGTDLSSDLQFDVWLNKDLNGAKRLFPSDLGSYELL